MNILVLDSWLREFLKTKAAPRQIAEFLSLCSQSVEKLTKVDHDWLYEIEITTNRSDCLSVYGIAKELAAILPRFGIKSRLAEIKEEKLPIPKIKKGLPLEIKIKNQSLCPRFTALIFDRVIVKPSPKIIRERLERSGIRALNNVVDISNYLMLELGQPMHTFDYDKITGAKMILRETIDKEQITTLDGQSRTLPAGTIIIEDGQQRIIDLCGIMGGENSSVDQNTKRVLLFVQTYDPVKIRQSCQRLSFRTEAASRFEKGVDPEGVILGIKKAILMFEKNCEAKVAGSLIDIYPNPPKTKTVSLSQSQLDQIMGISLKISEAKKILQSLGFKVTLDDNRLILRATVPHWRSDDITISEDLIEEVARIYGYHNLPNILVGGQISQTASSFAFDWEERIKDALKFWGFTETASYSMISHDDLKKIGHNPGKSLKIANPLTDDFVYLRPSLIPSLLKVISKNQAEKKEIKIFELANIYLPQNNNQLPNEITTLTGTITGNDFYQIKGIMEAVLAELGINDYKIVPYVFKDTIHGRIFLSERTGEILSKDNPLGVIGEIGPLILRQFGIKGRVVAFDFDFSNLVRYAATNKKYVPISKYPAIVEDLSFVVPSQTEVGKVIQLIKDLNPFIQSVELLGFYQNTRTFKITYQSNKKTLSDAEVSKIRTEIIKQAEKDFGLKIKSQ